MLAVLAFLPVALCPGYVLAWLADLHGFRRHSLAERICWSIPLSIAVSTITAVLVGKLISLSAVVVLFSLIALFFFVLLGWETSQSWKRAERTFHFGAVDRKTVFIALAWIAFTVLSLVDIQKGQRLYMSLTMFDHGTRVNWAESILRSGIPPANPMYFSQHSAALRYYYFWLVDCAVVSKMAHLSMRAVVIAGCVWSGLCIAALLALYLKRFLLVAGRLRTRFLIAIGLLTVTGPYIVIDLWHMFITHTAPPGLEIWPEGQITSWLDNFFFYPHHAAALACCMFAFLLAWMSQNCTRAQQALSILIIGASFASAFGLSIYIAFAFFLIMILWGAWQLAVERSPRPVVLLGLAGGVALVLLVPYLTELTQGTSKMQGGHVFALAVRETISPAGLLALPVMRNLAAAHPHIANNLAKLILLVPGYVIELGFYSIVLAVFLIAFSRRRANLDAAQRALLVIVLATFPVMSFIRSAVLNINDFGIHAGMFVEFPLLLLGSQFITSWKMSGVRQQTEPTEITIPTAPSWLVSSAKLLIVLGVLSTTYIAFMLRFGILVLPDTPERSLSHKAFIATLGYDQLRAVIPHDAIVQFNPAGSEMFWKNIDLINVDHQVAISGDQPACGAELGGDPTACPAMISAIVPLFHDATAAQAEAACSAYGIQYLVANIYDPVWKDRNSWVWTLHPAVADPEFRALDCTGKAGQP